MEHTRELHIVSAELSILKRTLHPLHTMINALRDQRVVRRKYIPQMAHEPAFEDIAPEYKPQGAEISVAAKVYLADVADHVLLITDEVDMLRGTVENMISMVSVHIEVADLPDIQHGFCHPKRNNETTYDSHRHFPAPHFPRRVFRNEFLSSLLASPDEQRSSILLDNCNSHDNLCRASSHVSIHSPPVQNVATRNLEQGHQSQVAQE
jgi:hypothetical protein